MTVREAEKVAGVRLEVLYFDAFDGLCYYAEPDGLDGLSFMVGSRASEPPADPRDGIILRAAATGPPWQTLSGIRVGATEAEVTAAYGARIERKPHVYQPGGQYLTLTGTGADARFGIRFETTPGRVVDDFFSGDADAITAIEGCA